MKSVDFKKYADIIINLEMQNNYYWLIKYFDSETLDHIRNRFTKESGMAFLQKFLQLQEEALQLQKNNVPAGSPKGLEFAKNYWNLIMEFTDGDTAMLPKLMELGQSEAFHQEWMQKQARANDFIELALDAYFSNSGINPFQEDAT